MIPVIAQFLKNKGIIVKTLVTYPFSFEKNRIHRADKGIQNISQTDDSVVVIRLDTFHQFLKSNVSLDERWVYLNQIIALALLISLKIL